MNENRALFHRAFIVSGTNKMVENEFSLGFLFLLSGGSSKGLKFVAEVFDASQCFRDTRTSKRLNI